MTIDFHTHAFPDKLADAAISSLGACSGLEPYCDGTVSSLRRCAAEDGVDICVVLNIATNEKQQQKVNDFAASINNTEGIVSFGSVYPLAASAIYELDRIKDMGLKGIKLHPDYQLFFVDDEKMIPFYRHIAKLGLITVFHAGADIGIYDPVHCTPERLSKVIKYFEGAPVVAAHFGGYLFWNDVEKYLVGKEIYFDTSFSYARIPLPQAKRIIERHGTDKILLGSDMPWSRAADGIKLIRYMNLTECDTEKIIGKNAARLLGIISV